MVGSEAESEAVVDVAGVTVGSDVVRERDGESVRSDVVGDMYMEGRGRPTTWDQSWLATTKATCSVGSNGSGHHHSSL